MIFHVTFFIYENICSFKLSYSFDIQSKKPKIYAMERQFSTDNESCVVVGLLVIFLLCWVPKSFGENEPNNNIETANVFELNGSVSGSFSASDYSYDFFRIIASEDGKLTISVSADAGLCVSLYLYNDTGFFTIINNGTCGLDNYLNTFSVDNLAAGTYYLEAGNSGYGNYSLSNSFVGANLNSDAEPNNDMDHALAISLNSITEGHLGFRNVHFDYYDYYTITTPADGALKFYIEPDPSLCVDLTIFNQSGGMTLYYNGYCSNSSHSDTLVINNLEAGTYQILASAVGFGAYVLTNQFVAATLPNDPEKNDEMESAQLMNLNSELTGHLGYRGTQTDYDDYYKIILPTNGKLNVIAAPDTSLCVEMNLYSGDGFFVLSSSGSCGNSNHKDTLVADNLLAGTYFVRASAVGYGSYKLSNLLGFATNLRFLGETGLEVYPNPFQNDIRVRLTENYPILYRICDLTGKTVKAGKLMSDGKTGTVDVSRLNRGLYVFELYDDRTKLRKLVQKK